MSVPRYHHAIHQHIRGSLTDCVQLGPGDVQGPGPTLTGMTNMYGTPAGTGSGEPKDRVDPAGSTDTPTRSPAARSRTKRMLGWGVGITLAGFLAGGGIALAISGGATPAASTVSTAGQVQGTMLNSELDTASGAGSAAPLPRIRWALGRLRALGGIDGEFTFHNQRGYHTLAFQRGTIASVSGSNVVVRSPDGTTWTWLIVRATVVRQNGGKTTTSALAPGETVFAGGPVINGARDARLIVIRLGSSSSSSVSGPAGTSVS